MNILIKVTASISVYKICEVVSKLKKMNFNVKVSASKSSLNFVGAAAWEALSGEKVFLDDFSPGQRMEHIHLNKWADLTLLAPVTAKTLNQLSLGVGDGVINTLFLARDQSKPYLIFPAMNPKMWSSPSVSKSTKELKGQENIFLYDPNEGEMACGDVGAGRLKEPFEIVSKVLKHLSFQKKALVTFGGTRESIDGVREISNFSTGNTGLRLVEELSKNMSVTALYSSSVSKDFSCSDKIKFKSSEDLESKLKDKISKEHYDLVYHLAAVSDYKPLELLDKKIDSKSDSLVLEFEKNKKILPEIKNWSLSKDLKVISFKLTHNQSDELVLSKINNQLEGDSSNFVVHNTLKGSRDENHKYKIFSDVSDRPIFLGDTKKDLIEDLVKLTFFNKENEIC